VKDLKIVRWTLLKEIQVKNSNLGIKVEPQMVKINANVDSQIIRKAKELLK
jgi:hypothetical protein